MMATAYGNWRRLGLSLGSLIVLATLSPIITADAYKWIDAEGNTHYGDSPPPDNVTAEQIKPPPGADTEAAQKQLREKQQQAQERSEQRAETEQKSAEMAREQAEKTEKCAAATKRLASYQRPRVNKVKADGSLRRIPEEERQAEIKKSRDYIDQFCN